MKNKKRELKDRVTKRDLIIAGAIIAFMIISAILSYFCGSYGFLRHISGGEKLFRFWIVVVLIVLVIEVIVRGIKRGKGDGSR